MSISFIGILFSFIRWLVPAEIALDTLITTRLGTKDESILSDRKRPDFGW